MTMSYLSNSSYSQLSSITRKMNKQQRDLTIIIEVRLKCLWVTRNFHHSWKSIGNQQQRLTCWHSGCWHYLQCWHLKGHWFVSQLLQFLSSFPVMIWEKHQHLTLVFGPLPLSWETEKKPLILGCSLTQHQPMLSSKESVSGQKFLFLSPVFFSLSLCNCSELEDAKMSC